MSSKRLGRRAVVTRIRRVAIELGRAPKIEELVERTEVRRRDVANNFDSYSQALILAGLMKTREMLARDRKRRGYVPPWNYNGGETKMTSDDMKAWRALSSSILVAQSTCEPRRNGSPIECAGRLIVNHIIPRRVGGPIFDPSNLDVMCDRHHKLHKPDLYWFKPEDVNFSDLLPYQIDRLLAGGLVSEEDLLSA